jgi:hypothetical protein
LHLETFTTPFDYQPASDFYPKFFRTIFFPPSTDQPAQVSDEEVETQQQHPHIDTQKSNVHFEAISKKARQKES